MNKPRQTRIPDGEGGWKIVDTIGETQRVEISEEKIQQRLQSAQEDDFFTRIGECATSLNRFLEIYAQDNNLSGEEVIAAVYLENLNNREFYPEGSKKVDQICKDVWEWFQKNK